MLGAGRFCDVVYSGDRRGLYPTCHYPGMARTMISPEMLSIIPGCVVGGVIGGLTWFFLHALLFLWEKKRWVAPMSSANTPAPAKFTPLGVAFIRIYLKDGGWLHVPTSDLPNGEIHIELQDGKVVRVASVRK